MSVLDPRELEASPLSDLHALAAELGMEGYRRLRKEDLIRQIVEAQGGTMPEAAPADDGGDDDDFEAIHEADTAGAPEPEEERRPRRRGRRAKAAAEEPSGDAPDTDSDEAP